MKILQKIFFGLALLFIPLAIVLDKIGGVPQPVLFFLAALAIFPLAALLVQGLLSAPGLSMALQKYAGKLLGPVLILVGTYLIVTIAAQALHGAEYLAEQGESDILASLANEVLGSPLDKLLIIAGSILSWWSVRPPGPAKAEPALRRA